MLVDRLEHKGRVCPINDGAHLRNFLDSDRLSDVVACLRYGNLLRRAVCFLLLSILSLLTLLMKDSPLRFRNLSNNSIDLLPIALTTIFLV